MAWDWPHLRHVRRQLADLTLGRCRKLLVSLPPQHGKTTQALRYVVWRMLRAAGLRAAVCAYNQTYANRLSRQCRRVARDAGVGFGERNAVNEWEAANGASLLAVGVGAGIAGRSVDLGYLDDVVRSREEADSPTYRERVWEWYMDDFTTRLQEGAGVVAVNTRWHEDDLFGRILASDDGPNWRYVRLPAIAEAGDPLGRAEGEALCPARFSLATLEERRRILGEGFEGLYQQNPVPRGGLFFRRDWFTPFLPAVPEGHPVRRVRYWDLASCTKDTNAYTSGVLMAAANGRYYVEHVVRVRLPPAERNEMIRKTADQDANLPGFERTWFEEQPGAAGVETSQALVRKLAGLPVRADRVSGSKQVRAEPLADAARGGAVRVVAGGWADAFLAELASFPRGQFADQVDSSAGAFAKLARPEGELRILGGLR